MVVVTQQMFGNTCADERRVFPCPVGKKYRNSSVGGCRVFLGLRYGLTRRSGPQVEQRFFRMQRVCP